MYALRTVAPILGLAAALALAAAPAQAGQVYKWVDEKGVTHYGEKAPDKAKASQVKVSDDTSSDAEDEIKELEGRRAAAADAEKKEKEKAAAEKKAPAAGSAEDKERIRKLCEQHRQNLQALQTGKRLMTKDEKGNPRYLTDQELAEKRQYTEGEVQRCGSFDKASP